MKNKKNGMNLPNKITCIRLIIAILVLLIMCMPWSLFNIHFPIYTIFSVENVNLKYIICGVLFMIGSLSDFLDGYIARKYSLVTDFGKVMDAIADKILVNGVLIILAYDKMIPLSIPVIIITRDIFVDSIKMVCGSKGKVVAASWPGKIKTIFMMIGVTLTFFYNLPFCLIGNGIRVAEICVYIATIMSLISGCQYYLVNKDFLFKEM